MEDMGGLVMDTVKNHEPESTRSGKDRGNPPGKNQGKGRRPRNGVVRREGPV